MAMRALFVIVFAAHLAAQQPAFEVVSVRPNKSGPGGAFIRREPGGAFAAGNVTVRDLLLYAYRVPRYRMVGGPDWMGGDRFDIQARAGREFAAASGGVSEDRLMLRSLLADRFRLAAQYETREMPIYTLVLARSDGRLGPQLRRSSIDCATAKPPCGGSGGPGTMSGRGMAISAFPDALSGQVQRLVVDRTGLTGLWDLELTFAPEGAPTAGATPDTRPSVFTALQEQLGLKLEPATGPVEVLVIDRVERPSPD